MSGLFCVHRRELNYAIQEANHLTREQAEALADALQAENPRHTFAVTELVFHRVTGYWPHKQPDVWCARFQSALDHLETHE